MLASLSKFPACNGFDRVIKGRYQDICMHHPFLYACLLITPRPPSRAQQVMPIYLIGPMYRLRLQLSVYLCFFFLTQNRTHQDEQQLLLPGANHAVAS